MRGPSLLAVSVLGVSALLACGEATPTPWTAVPVPTRPGPADARVAGVEARLPELEAIEGEARFGRSETHFRAFVEPLPGHGVLYAEERRRLGARESAEARYWMQDRVLVRTLERAQRRGVDPTSPETSVAVALWIDFDAQGEPLLAERRQAGVTGGPTPGEIAGARRRAELLRREALARRFGLGPEGLRCRPEAPGAGEPAWSLAIDSQSGRWKRREDRAALPYSGRFDAPTASGSGLRWRGDRVPSTREPLLVDLRRGACADAPYAAALTLPDGQRLRGCCRAPRPE